MKNVIYSILSIMLCVVFGKLAAHYMGALPSSLYGLICFTALLHFKVLAAEKIKLSIDWAIRNMSVCFVPAGVGIIEHFDLIKQHGLAIIFIIFVSTFILMTFVGVVFEKRIKKQKQHLPTNS